jgi:hypothetical protein
MTITPRHSLFMVALFSLLGLSICGRAMAQTPNIAGEWNTYAGTYGQMHMTLRQDGNTVVGTAGSHGQIQGTINGNVLQGTYQDVTINFRFSADGSSFQGSYAVGGPNANGSQEWRGTRAGDVAATPQQLLEQRANLAQVTQSPGSYEEQAKAACNNLLSNTFTRNGDELITRFTIRQSSFTQVLGAPQQATKYLKFGGYVYPVPERPLSFDDAGTRNGWQFQQRIFVQARSYQLTDQPNDQNWQSLGQQPINVIACIYAVRNNRSSIAVEKPIERLTTQQLPSMEQWSRP